MDPQQAASIELLLASTAQGIDILANVVGLESRAVRLEAVATLICALRLDADLVGIGDAVRRMAAEMNREKIILPGQ